jgi:hypothetical protein
MIMQRNANLIRRNVSKNIFTFIFTGYASMQNANGRCSIEERATFPAQLR